MRALRNAKIRDLKALSKWKKAAIADLHGMGPKGLDILHRALRKNKLSFAR